MTDWFRSWHGAPTDTRWLVIARRANVPRVYVTAVAWSLIDHASQNLDRGRVSDFDADVCAAVLEIEEEQVRAILAAMTDRGFIAGGKLMLWFNYFEGDRPSGPKWQMLREEVFARDNHTCRYCGKRGGRMECDHIVPVALGGSHDIQNLVTACLECNRSKRDKLLENWRKTSEGDA